MASSTWPQSTWEERKKNNQWEHLGKGGSFHYSLLQSIKLKSKIMEGHRNLGLNASVAIC